MFIHRPPAYCGGWDPKLSADADVELVIFPPRKGFYELLTEQFGGGSSDKLAMSAWLASNLSRGVIEGLRMMRGPLAMFRRGEPLALMPVSFIR